MKVFDDSGSGGFVSSQRLKYNSIQISRILEKYGIFTDEKDGHFGLDIIESPEFGEFNVFTIADNDFLKLLNLSVELRAQIKGYFEIGSEIALEKTGRREFSVIFDGEKVTIEKN